jgi:glycosyltransferase involved in cell wall biosynthesis
MRALMMKTPLTEEGSVLFLVPKLFCGGVERSVIDIYNYLQQQNTASQLLLGVFYPAGEFAAQVQQPVLVPRYPKWLHKLIHTFLPGAKQQVSEISIWQEILHIMVASLVLPSLLEQSQPRVIISFTHHAMLAIWLRKRLLKKYQSRWIIVEGSNITYELQSNAQKSWIYRQVHKVFQQVYHTANHVVTVSKGLSQSLSQTFDLPKQQVSCIHNPIVQLANEPEAILPVDFPYIIAVGRLVAVKGFDVLLEAYAKMAAQFTPKLIILGEGPQQKALQQLIVKLRLQHRVLLPGFVPNPRAWMRTAKLLVLSSKMEGLGNVILEAMAEGTPVIATNCDFGPRDIIQDGFNGKLVPVDDPQALATAMTELLSQPMQGQVYAQNALQTLEGFSINVICRAYAKLFSQFGVDIKCR